jgi:hypothetical protein
MEVGLMWLRRQTGKEHTPSPPMMRARICSYMERVLTPRMMETTAAGALAMPFVFLLSLFFFGVTFAGYVFVWWLGGVAVLTIATGILLRRGASNDASLRFAEVSDESQEKPQPVASTEAS